jgi:hypothetical protein
MSERINNDNIYKLGSLVTAKDIPSRKLVIANTTKGSTIAQ